MSRQLSSDRAHVKRITAAATVLALAGGAATVPLGPALPVAHAQVAPVPQEGLSHGAVRQTFGVNPDWEASVFFSDAMTVRTVAVDFVPQKTGQSALERPEQAPKDDPVFNVIPETATYTVKHYKQVNRRTVEAATYEVTGRRSQAETPSGNWAIRIAYDLPDVAVEKSDRLALFATGMGVKYPKPLAGGDIRFTMPRINSGFGGTIRVHDPDGEEVEPPKLLLQQGTTTTDVPVEKDGTYQLTINGASGTYTAKVVPPAGFASPEPRTWDVASGAPDRDFDVYPITVSGRLLDASGGNPVQGAKVTIAGRNTTTDENGNFTVTKVPVGTHDLVFGDTTTTRGDKVSGVVVSDQRDNQIGQHRVDLKPQFGTVSGRVTDPDNKGVANVTVTAGGTSATTAADGTYSITGVPTGSVSVAADPKTLPTGFSVNGPLVRDVTTAGVTGVDFSTTRDTGTVSGKVTGPDGNKGVANVTVLAGGKSAKTATDGSYSITGVPTGATSVKVDAKTVPAGFSVSGAQQKNVTTAGVSGVNFSTTRDTGTVSGQVIGSGNKGVAGVTVTAGDKTATTAADGTYSITGVPTGSVSVAADPKTLPTGFSVNGPLVRDVTTAGVTGVDFSTTRDTGTVSGKVTGPDGNKGVANVTVLAGGKSAKTATDGSYSITGVPTGATSVRVVAGTVPTGYSVNGPFDHNVTTAGVAGVNFSTTRETASVSGSVKDAAGKPVKNPTVKLVGINGNGDSVEVPVNADGLIDFSGVPTGDYKVTVTAPGYVTSESQIKVTGQGPNKMDVELQRETASVSGKVVDPSGKGIAKVTVQAGDVSATTNADGEFSIAGVPTGSTTIKVTVIPTGYVLPPSKQVNVTVGGVQNVDFPLALRPKPSPTPTTPRLTTARPTPKPSPTTPKPTPTSTTTTTTPTSAPKPTQPPAPTVGSVSGKVTDASGKVVPGATVTARDANGKEYTVQVAKDGTFQLNNLPPGNYTVTVGVPKGHVAPPPANVTVKAGQTVKLPGFVVNPEKPKARFDWDRVVVKPGETQVSAPKRSGDTTSAPSFRTTGVTKVSPDGKTTQIPAEDRWISVEKDGTVVARPPRNAAPGEYRVVAKDAAGQTHTITVEVAQPAPMAKQHEVRFPLIPVPAGATRQAGRPRATVTDGPFVYQDRRVPEGARFDVDPAFASWVRADDNGRLTFTPPRDAKPGIRTIPVKVTFPDKSFRTYNAEVEIGDPLLALTTELGYEEGLSVRPGEGVTVLRTGTTVLPQGTTFEIDRSAPLDGWVALVDSRSGDLRLFAPKQGSDVEVPVIAYFADGSSTELTAGVGLSTSSALSTKHSPSYADVSAAPGGTATVGLTGSVPSGTTFVVVDGGGLRNVGVDRQTGSLKIQLAPDAQRDTPYTVTVRVRYADGSTEEIAAKVTAVSDAVRFSPQVAGGDGASVRTGLPRGAKLVDFDHTGWDVAFDSATGELTATPNSDVPAGTVLKVPVKATFPDGSTKIVEYPVTATAAPETKPQQGSSASAGWIAVVLGALVAVAGVGYAAFLNQDAIRAQLKQFGF